MLVLVIVGMGVWWLVSHSNTPPSAGTAAPTDATTRSSPRDPFVDVTRIVRRSPLQVEALLGKSTHVLPPDEPTGEQSAEVRFYTLGNGGQMVQVGYFKGEAGTIIAQFNAGDAATASEALRLMGLDESELTLVFETPESVSPEKFRRYKGSAAGTTYDEVGVTYYPAGGSTQVVLKVSGYPHH